MESKRIARRTYSPRQKKQEDCIKSLKCQGLSLARLRQWEFPCQAANLKSMTKSKSILRVKWRIVLQIFTIMTFQVSPRSQGQKLPRLRMKKRTFSIEGKVQTTQAISQIKETIWWFRLTKDLRSSFLIAILAKSYRLLEVRWVLEMRG